MKWTDAAGHSFTLRDAWHVGNLEAGGGKTPAPLQCVAIAWKHVPEHVEIVRQLVERGAVIADTVLQEHWIDTTLSDAAIDVGRALGIDGEQLRGPRAARRGRGSLRRRQGAVRRRGVALARCMGLSWQRGPNVTR